MTHAVRGLGLAATLVLVSSLAAAPQARAQSTSAYVYVQIQGPAGAVYGYNSSASGQLTAIPGSPFKPGTAMVGGNGSQFFTMGQTLLHSYSVSSSGAIGSQLSQAPVFDYGGSSCGAANSGGNGAVLDHSGKYVYVLLQGSASGTCEAYQSYALSSGGDFTFLGDAEESVENIEPVSGGVGLPSILGNEMFAYADAYSGHLSNVLGLKRASTGELETMQFTETDPTLGGYSANYTPAYPDADPAGNYVVIQLFPYDSNPVQLGSYTVDSAGNLTTTNTSSNMPTTALEGPSSTFAPDGSLFVLFSDQGSGTASNNGNGIEIYNFNGAAPLTLNTKLLTGTPIAQVAWDSSNHLYAISYQDSKLYVYTVTATSAVLDSTTSITSPLGLVVVSQTPSTTTPPPPTCSAPSSNGVNVCTPDNGATVTSPVSINAAATVSGGVYRFSLWNGDTKLLNEDNGTMDGTVSLAPGTYTLTFDAENSSGTHEYATRDVTVSGGSGGACAAPTGNGVNVCSPAQGATVTSPVEINAAATVSGGVYRFSLWNGDAKLLNEDNGTMDEPLSLAPGSYKLTFDAENKAGVHAYATLNITVQ